VVVVGGAVAGEGVEGEGEGWHFVGREVLDGYGTCIFVLIVSVRGS
jgi:hypothetical protein